MYYRIAKDLKSYQRTLLRAVDQLRGERDDFREDEARVSRRLRLRRGGLCCVGFVSRNAQRLRAKASDAP